MAVAVAVAVAIAVAAELTYIMPTSSRVAQSPPPPSASEAKPVHDIVSEYPYLVMPFVLLQLVSWTLALCQAAGIVGHAAWATTELLGPIDLSLCQMMFWGTLHHGPSNDGRLSVICRCAFLIEAVVYLVNFVTVYRPTSLGEAVAALNVTAVADDASRMVLGYVNAGLWFTIWAVFSAWIGVLALQFGRRRLLEQVGADSRAAFSDRLLRVYAFVLAVQGGLVVWAAAQAATAQSPEARVFASKVATALQSLSICAGHLYGFKVVLFNASGSTFAQLRAGQAAGLVCAAVCVAVLYVALGVPERGSLSQSVRAFRPHLTIALLSRLFASNRRAPRSAAAAGLAGSSARAIASGSPFCRAQSRDEVNGADRGAPRQPASSFLPDSPSRPATHGAVRTRATCCASCAPPTHRS